MYSYYLVIDLQRADAEAAKLYEEFAASFGSEEPEAAGGRSFVRGGTIQPGSRPSAGTCLWSSPPSIFFIRALSYNHTVKSVDFTKQVGRAFIQFPSVLV